jgi:hypothetical protein
MKRLVALLFLLAVSPVSAAQPQPVTGVDYERVISPYVKQQSPGSHDNEVPQTEPSTWVRNPTTCVWDADDRFTVTINGFLNAGQSNAYLDAGDSFSLEECVISDGWWITHLTAVRIWASSPDLVISIDYGDAAVVAVPIPDGSAWLYRACRYPPTGSPWSEVPGSTSDDGSRTGVGTRFPLTFTIANPTGRRIRGIGGVLVVTISRATHQATYCP